MGAFERLERWQWVYAASLSTLSVLASYGYARARFRAHVGVVTSTGTLLLLSRRFRAVVRWK